MEKTFEIEVLERLTKIETKLDGYGETKKVAYDAQNRSKQNEQDIIELQDKFKWLSRTTGASIIAGVVGIVFIFIKIGMGVN